MSRLLLALAAVCAAVAPLHAQTLEPAELIFTVLASRPDIVTPAQRVFIESPRPSLPWTAVADRGWVEVQSTSGTTPGRLTIGVRPAAFPGQLHEDEGHVTVTVVDGTTATRAVLRVTLRVLPAPRSAIGAIDAPADGTVVSEPVRLSGWALHEVWLAGVTICRDHVPHAPTSDACGGDLTPIGEATIYHTARPDVASAVPTFPFHERAGWTYVLDPRAFTRGALGTFHVYAIARGTDGTRSSIGSRSLTVMPGAKPASTPIPYARAIFGLVCAGFVFHLLLRWFCAGRLRDAAAEADPEPARTRVELAGIAAIVLLSLGINLRELGGGLTYDELYTASHYAVGVPFWTAAIQANAFTNHIAYSLLAALSVRIFGASEFALRLPAALLGALAVAAVWRYARTWAGPGTALAAALVLAVLPFHAHWCRMARGYAGVALMTVLAVHAFRAVVRRATARGAAGHAIALVLAVYFHLYALWVFLMQYALFTALAVISAWRRDEGAPLSRRSFRLLWLSFLGAGVLILVLYAPVAGGLLRVLPSFAEREGIRGGLFVDVFTAFAGTGAMAARAGIGVLIALGAAYLWRRSALDVIHLLALIVVPIACVVLILRPRVELERYFAYWIPAFALFVAGGLAAVATWPSGLLRSKAVRVAGLTVAGVVLAALSAGWIRQDALDTTGEEYRGLLAPLNAPPRPAVFAVGADSEMFQFYVDRPLGTFASMDDLEQALLTAPPFRVAYFDVSWNSLEQMQMQALLERRCHRTTSSTVQIYQCGE